MAAFDFHDIQVAGAVYGASTGILLGTLATKQSDLNSGIWIGADGSVTGGATGITTQGSGISVTNEGTIYGGSYGLSHIGNSLHLINLGTIAGPGDALYIRGTENLIENHGVITSSEIYGIFATSDTILPVAASASITVENHGTLSGQAAAFYAPAMRARRLHHDAAQPRRDQRRGKFADGDDLYDGRDGTATYVAGNTGNDTMLGGDARDTFLGEGGNDLLEGGAGNDLLVGGTEADTLEGGDGTTCCARVRVSTSSTAGMARATCSTTRARARSTSSSPQVRFSTAMAAATSSWASNGSPEGSAGTCSTAMPA